MTTYNYTFRTRALAESTAEGLRIRHTRVRVREQKLAKAHPFTVKGKKVMKKIVYKIDYAY